MSDSDIRSLGRLLQQASEAEHAALHRGDGTWPTAVLATRDALRSLNIARRRSGLDLVPLPGVPAAVGAKFARMDLEGA